jgi:hypothetical protein
MNMMGTVRVSCCIGCTDALSVAVMGFGHRSHASVRADVFVHPASETANALRRWTCAAT